MLPVVMTYFLLHIELFGPYDLMINGVRVLSMASQFFFVAFLLFFWLQVLNALADLSSGRELVAQLKPLKDVLPFLPLVLGLVIFPGVFHFLLFMLTGNETLSLTQVSLIISPLMFRFTAERVFRIKGYFSGTSNPQGSVAGLLIMYAAVAGALALDHSASLLTGQATFKMLIGLCVDVIRTFILYYAFMTLGCSTQDTEVTQNGPELILINPVLAGRFSGMLNSLFSQYPMFFASIRAFTPARYRVIELNRSLWAEPGAARKALVAISCYTSNAALAYTIARDFRGAGAKVIMGGPHVRLFPDEALEFCDAVVIGPAEGVWGRIIEDYERGELAAVYQGSSSEADLDRVHEYLMKAPAGTVNDTLMITRGCKFRCYFCTHSTILNTEPRQMGDVLDLFKHIREQHRFLTFQDSNIYMNRAYCRELLEKMIPLKIKWNGCVSLDIAKDEEMVELLKKSGCDELMIGYEIAPGSKEEKHKGKFAMTGDYLMLSQRLKKAGIKIKAMFMFGCPTDDWHALWNLWKFCFRLLPNSTGLSYMTPLPGSVFYDDVAREDRFINLNWSSYTGQKMVCSHSGLGSNYILQHYFRVVSFLFFVTTSRSGFIVFGGVIVAVWFFICL